MFSKKTYLALSLTTALVAASQPGSVQAAQDESFRSRIVDAAQAGKQEDVLDLLQRGVNPNERGEFGTSALLRAASNGDLEVAKILIENGGNANVSDLGGATALHIAARNGDIAMARFLLENKADANATDSQGNTPLMLSAINGNKVVAELLLQNGADMNATNDSGENALHYATEEQAEGVVDMLVAMGARKDLIDEEGYTASEIAARKSDSLLVAKLDSENPNHVMISMGRGFRSTSADERQVAAAPVPSKANSFQEIERQNGEQLLAALNNNDVIDYAESEFLGNPSDPSLSFFDTPRFEPAAGKQLASLEKKEQKSWLSGVKNALDDAGVFELASVKNFSEGNKYSLLELGSFKVKAFAEKRISELQADHSDVLKDVPLVVFERGSGDNVEYYVNGGIFDSSSEAESICKELSSRGVRCNAVESALITENQYSKLSASTKSAFSAPAVVQQSLVDAVPEIPKAPAFAEIATPELPLVSANAPEIKAPAVEVSKAEDILEVPALTKVSKVTPQVVPNDDALSLTAAKKSIPQVPVVEEDTSLIELAGMSEKEPAEEKPSVNALVDAIYKEKEEAVVVPVAPKIVTPKVVAPKPVAFAESVPKQASVALPKLTENIEKTEDVKNQIQELPKLASTKTSAPSIASSTKEPVKIVFAKPEEAQNISIANVATPRATISSDSTNRASLVTNYSTKTEPLSASAAPKIVKTPVARAEPETIAIPAVPVQQSERTDKFVVAKPVRVNDAYTATPTVSTSGSAYNTSIKTSSTTDVYVRPAPTFNRKEKRRMAKVEFFETASSAEGLYWKYRENGVLNESITVRATRDLMGGPYYSSLIGEFRTSADAQAFCNRIYSVEKLRCSVLDEIDYKVSPRSNGSSSKYKRHSSYNNTSSSLRRHSSR